MPKREKTTSGDAWIDPDDAPDWATEVFDLAEAAEGERILRPATGVLKRGRPRLDQPKVRVTLRLDADVLDKLRDDGPGWQTRANGLLRKAVGM
ncbi:MAG: BrnA antitoxin family protein [Caulobacteraceae bacterium]